MKEVLVSSETAKLAKNKGFNIVTELVYANQVVSQLEPYNQFRYNNYGDYCMAPTLSLLQKWLREVHSKHFHILSVANNGDFVGWTHAIGNVNNWKFTHWKTYEEAQEEAIILLLNSS